MSKTLLIFRHGKTHKEGYDRDFDRELTHRGEVQSKHIGKDLKKRGWIPDRILSSPAARALATARIAAEAMGFDGEVETVDKLYGIDARGIVSHAAGLDDGTDMVMFVGHNPAFEEAASVLAGRSVALGTGDCAMLSWAAESWKVLDEGESPAKYELVKSD